MTDVHPPLLSELRGLLKTLVCGLKNIMWGIAHFNQTTAPATPAGQARPTTRLLYAEEVS